MDTGNSPPKKSDKTEKAKWSDMGRRLSMKEQSESKRKHSESDKSKKSSPDKKKNPNKRRKTSAKATPTSEPVLRRSARVRRNVESGQPVPASEKKDDAEAKKSTAAQAASTTETKDDAEAEQSTAAQEAPASEPTLRRSGRVRHNVELAESTKPLVPAKKSAAPAKKTPAPVKRKRRTSDEGPSPAVKKKKKESDSELSELSDSDEPSDSESESDAEEASEHQLPDSEAPEMLPYEPSDSEDEKSEEYARQPPAWASCRAELCAAMAPMRGAGWFNAWQTITHSSRFWGIFGFLLDSNNGCQYIDDEILIIGLSGSYKKEKSGKYVLKEDHTLETHKHAAHWFMNMTGQKPVGLVIGDQSNLLKFELPHRYNVLDYFMVTDIWQQRENGKAKYTVRLQKLNLSQRSWWSKKGSPKPVPAAERDYTPPEVKECACGTKCPQVYAKGWMCLNGKCDKFWEIDGVKAENSQDLGFDEKFLSYRKEFDMKKCLNNTEFPLIPPTKIDTDDSHSRRDGVVCPKCKRCVPRVFLGEWKCEIEWAVQGKVEFPRKNEKDCRWQYDIAPRVDKVSVSQVAQLQRAWSSRRKVKAAGGIKTIPKGQEYAIWRRTLDGPDGEEAGIVTHFIANRWINAKANGPDKLFERLQAQCKSVGFRRCRGTAPVVPGTLSNNFLKNAGLPYDFQIPNKTQPFDEFDAENPGVMHAYARLDWAFHEVSKTDGNVYHKANELLLIAYQEKQKLRWHDDGDGRLGPQIATLCLGAECSMMFRMKGEYYFGIDHLGRLPDVDVILPGCRHEEIRRELKEKFETGVLTKRKYDKERKKVIERGPGSWGKRMLKIKLHHGDIVVMNGEDIQKYYEHCVDHIHGMRFAVTARHLILKSHEVKFQMKKWAVDKTAGDYEIKEDEVYHGD